jgi:hypothetical protein
MCVCLCVFVCMYVCMYVCMHACMHASMYVCMYVCEKIQTPRLIRLLDDVCVSVCVTCLKVPRHIVGPQCDDLTGHHLDFAMPGIQDASAIFSIR